MNTCGANIFCFCKSLWAKPKCQNIYRCRSKLLDAGVMPLRAECERKKLSSTTCNIDAKNGERSQWNTTGTLN